MAWSAQKNQIFFERARNWAAAIANLREERARLIDLYTNEAKPGGVDDPAFVDTEIATKEELLELANVMNALDALVAGTQVNAVSGGRMQFLTPFLSDQQ